MGHYARGTYHYLETRLPGAADWEPWMYQNGDEVSPWRSRSFTKAGQELRKVRELITDTGTEVRVVKRTYREEVVEIDEELLAELPQPDSSLPDVGNSKHEDDEYEDDDDDEYEDDESEDADSDEPEFDTKNS